MTVNQIVTLHKQGLIAEQIVQQYPHRTLREIYAVLAWYYDHQAEFAKSLQPKPLRMKRPNETIKIGSERWRNRSSSLMKMHAKMPWSRRCVV
jgi:hypothetical protein